MPTENTINCESIFPLLSVYVDGEATTEEAFRVERHVDTCKGCASHLAFLRATSFVLTGVPDAVPDPALFARIASATYAKPSLREQLAEKVGVWLRPMPVRYALGSALAVALAAIVVVPRYAADQPSGVSALPSPEKNSASQVAIAAAAASHSALKAPLSGSKVIAPVTAAAAGAKPRRATGPQVASTKAVKKRQSDTTAAAAIQPALTPSAPMVLPRSSGGKNGRAVTLLADKKNGGSSGSIIVKGSTSVKIASGGKSSQLKPAGVAKTRQVALLSPSELRSRTEIFRPHLTLPYRHETPRVMPGESRAAALSENVTAAAEAARLTKPSPLAGRPENVAGVTAVTPPDKQPLPSTTAGSFRVQGNGRTAAGSRTYNIAGSAKDHTQGTVAGLLPIVTSDLH